MNTNRKLARELLNDSSRTNFWEIVHEAKIPKADQEILDARFIRGESITKISLEQNYSVEKVNRVIKKAYDKVYNLIYNRV